jgi:L-Ala-D/L-Glu epimerase
VITAEDIRSLYEKATYEFSASRQYQTLVAGEASTEFVRQFLLNIFRTHYLSAHIVALCFAALPSSAADLLKENLLEEMGHGDEPPHSALLLQLAGGIGCSQGEIDQLTEDARKRVALFCASRVPSSTLREICLAVLLETLSFEFMLSRCSDRLAKALNEHYGIAKTALSWFELHSEVDVRHAEEALTVIEDYVKFHQISNAAFERIQLAALSNVFAKHYFPAQERVFALTADTDSSCNIETVTIYRLRIPFQRGFHHAAQSREESDAVVVRVTDASGRSGYGEALPRPYVTGENTDTLIADLREHLTAKIFNHRWSAGWGTFDALDACRADWTRSERAEVVARNAAFCAVELALLDWSLRTIHCSLADFLPAARHEVVYSGVISSDQPDEATNLARRMVKFGLRQIKIKVGTPDDIDRVTAVRHAVGPDIQLRADANGAWTVEEALARLKQLAPFHLELIEQPVAATDIAGLRRVHQESGTAVMVDESLVTLAQARQLAEQRCCDYFNIRLSKNGGITGSLAILKLAQEAGIKVQVGAQVGETAILSAAARTFAAHLPEIAFAEGSFGTWLLNQDIAFEDVSFGYAGIAPLLQGRGLGVTVKDEALERLAVEKIELRR